MIYLDLLLSHTRTYVVCKRFDVVITRFRYSGFYCLRRLSIYIYGGCWINYLSFAKQIHSLNFIIVKSSPFSSIAYGFSLSSTFIDVVG